MILTEAASNLPHHSYAGDAFMSAERESLMKYRDPATGQYPGRAMLAELDTLWAEVQELRKVAAACAAERERASSIREKRRLQQRARRALARHRHLDRKAKTT